MLLVICDNKSNFIEVERITHTTTGGVTKALKIQFARYGVPDTVVLDNRPQFSAEEFVTFSKSWGFTHVTSSLHYPQSNGKRRMQSRQLNDYLRSVMTLVNLSTWPSKIGVIPPQKVLEPVQLNVFWVVAARHYFQQSDFASSLPFQQSQMGRHGPNNDNVRNYTMTHTPKH